ncbi:hypothetical protein LPY66_13180 [Dehalobacter sp. DCM]|uniref:hypothetical protein n=1 Tax=Dehalobacter sp. DCM TaxID=2907827 RepID=UPI003081B6B6|nr:hypothetical protein LPY66_13180 [Dehalobacter sp. DCM]
MKTAGYDIALLLNERFLNQLSGALFYSGFFTINGWVDFYQGSLSLEQAVMDYEKELAAELTGKIPEEVLSYLKMAFRFKLTREPVIDFAVGADGQGQCLRVAAGMRVYFFLWDGLEIKFDIDMAFRTGLQIDSELNLVADLKNGVIDELTIKYGKAMEADMTLKLSAIVEKAVHLYFANHTICKRLELPSLSTVVKDVTDYIQPDHDENGNDLGIIPVTVDAIQVVSPTVLALGINLMGYKGGNPTLLHDFARNCSVAVAVSETAIFKVFSYVWQHSQCVKSFGSDGSMCLVKEADSLTIAKAKTLKIKKLDDFFSDVSQIGSYVQKLISKGLTAGFVESSIEYRGMNFQYALAVKLKNEPKFDLLGGNKIAIYNMAFEIFLRLACRCTIKYETNLDTSGWIPDSWTPWDDDVVLYQETKTYTLFDLRIFLKNLELRYGEGLLVWNEKKHALEMEITKINLYWDFEKPESPLFGLPERLINWIMDQLEDDIVKKLPKITVTPSLRFNLPIIPFALQMKGRKLEITNSEAVVAVDCQFNELQKDIYPVAKYIVNTNNREIHKIGCDSVTDTYEVHQRGFHLLGDALNLGYDGCKNCLPAFHKR